jgi:DNA-binding GntR family transcriptional regulator
LEVNM